MKKTILLIEDNIQQAELISKFLRINNFNVINAYDGKNGVKMIRKYLPDFIVMDYILPEINGLDILSIIKSSDDIAHIPTLIISANNIKPMNCNFLRKPFQFAALKNIIDNSPICI